MHVDELRRMLDAFRITLKGREGKPCVYSDSGPPTLGLVESLITAIEGQQIEIASLERRIAAMEDRRRPA